MILRVFAILNFFIFFIPMACSAQASNRRKATEVRLTYVDGMVTYYRYHREGKLKLLQSQYVYNPESYKMDTSGNAHLVASDLSFRDQYFVYHQDSLAGFIYDPHRGKQDGMKAKVDSMLRLVEIQFDNLSSYLRKPDSLTSSADGIEVREVFVEPKTDTRPAGRSVFVYNKNLLHITESFSPELEKVKGKKLVRIEFHVDSFYDPRSKKTYPANFVIDELREVDVENAELIDSYFQQYRKQTGRIN